MQYLQETISVNGKDARLCLYLADKLELAPEKRRPMLLVCPGGAYAFTSDREAEPIALHFLARGYQAAILYYSCGEAGLGGSDTEFPLALTQLAKAVAHIRANAEAYHVDPQRITVNGYSAGGHLVASLGVFWNSQFLKEIMGCAPALYQPNALLLAYPVITSGPYAHEGSIQNLLGRQLQEPGMREKMSLEDQVSADVPPTFLWTTNEDGAVPAENSLYFALALRRAGVPVELHMYAHGGHGLSLANEEVCPGNEVPAVQNWTALADTWMQGLSQ